MCQWMLAASGIQVIFFGFIKMLFQVFYTIYQKCNKCPEVFIFSLQNSQMFFRSLSVSDVQFD